MSSPCTAELDTRRKKNILTCRPIKYMTPVSDVIKKVKVMDTVLYVFWAMGTI